MLSLFSLLLLILKQFIFCVAQTTPLTLTSTYNDLLYDDILPSGLNNMTCQALLQSYQNLDCQYSNQQGVGGPPRNMPAELARAYTLNGTIPTGEYFVDDTNSSQVRSNKYDLNLFRIDFQSKSITCCVCQGTFYQFSEGILNYYIQAARENKVLICFYKHNIYKCRYKFKQRNLPVFPYRYGR